MSKTQRVFTRDLPGGGFAAIDVVSVQSLLHRRLYHGALSVERRAEARRRGHAPPIIATARGSSVESILRKLLPIVQCNAALGAALLNREQQVAY